MTVDESCKYLGEAVLPCKDAEELVVADVFRGAMISGASQITTVHNYDDVYPDPTPADWEVAKKLREAGSKLGIALVDFVIIGSGGQFWSAVRELGTHRSRIPERCSLPVRQVSRLGIEEGELVQPLVDLIKKRPELRHVIAEAASMPKGGRRDKTRPSGGGGTTTSA